MSTAAAPVTPRACPECVAHDEDPAPWCDCEADGTTYCAGPCSNRAHDPDQCPRVGCTPAGTLWEDDVALDWAAANDALRAQIDKLEAELQDCWTTIPLRWRHVRPGDIVVLKGKTWAVTAANPDLTEQQTEITVVRGAKLHEACLDADATVPVLVRHQEREALQLAREQLGATVVDRRV